MMNTFYSIKVLYQILNSYALSVLLNSRTLFNDVETESLFSLNNLIYHWTRSLRSKLVIFTVPRDYYCLTRTSSFVWKEVLVDHYFCVSAVSPPSLCRRVVPTRDDTADYREASAWNIVIYDRYGPVTCRS